jgi:intracellular sulfur oxidation DsrE/DsrF family protein
LLLITLKHPLPAVVARLLPYKILIACLCLLTSVFALADSERLLVQLHAHTPAELSRVLDRAEKWSEMHDTYIDRPISVVLHGNEAKAFLKENYQEYRSLVDQAAKLDAFNVVDIQICERWMGNNEVSKDQLPPFIDTVVYGPARINELIESAYQSF